MPKSADNNNKSAKQRTPSQDFLAPPTPVMQAGGMTGMMGAPGMMAGSAAGAGGHVKQDEGMVLGDVHTSMSALMQENRYLQMMQ